MPTLVALHAHPDDEAIFTGGAPPACRDGRLADRRGLRHQRRGRGRPGRGAPTTSPAVAAVDALAGPAPTSSGSKPGRVPRPPRNSGASGLGSFASGTLAAADPEAIARQVVDLLDAAEVQRRPSPPTTRSASTGTPPTTSPCTAPACTSPALGTPVCTRPPSTPAGCAPSATRARRPPHSSRRGSGRRTRPTASAPAAPTSSSPPTVTADLPGQAGRAGRAQQPGADGPHVHRRARRQRSDRLLGHEDFVPACEPRSAGFEALLRDPPSTGGSHPHLGLVAAAGSVVGVGA